MRTALGIIALVILCATSTLAQTPAHSWSQRFGSTLSDAGDVVTVDGAGNVLVTGYFQGTVNFGGADLVSVGTSDVFIAKYNANGVHQWSKRVGGVSPEQSYGIAVDLSGNVVVAGFFQGTANFGGADLVSAGANDIFVARYNASGTHLWSKRFGGTSNDLANGVATDNSGNVVVTGQFQNTVNFGGVDLVSAGGTDIFLAKYNSGGTHQWSQRLGSTGGDIANAVAMDGSGNAVMTGTFQGTVDFGGGGLVSVGSNDIFLAKYNSSGVHQWSHRFGGSSEGAYGVDVDGSGNVVMTGYMTDTIDFGGGTLTGVGGYDVFLAKFTSAGVHVWSKRFGGTGVEIGHSVGVNSAGAIALTGEFEGTVNFGGGNRVSAGLSDIFLVKYNANGTHQWSRGFGSSFGEVGNSAAVDNSGNVVFTGPFSATLDFGGGGLVSAGSGDVFLAKYGSVPQEPVITSIADIGNDQGRQVKIRFTGSAYDGDNPTHTVVQYVAFRRDDPPPSGAPSSNDLANLSERQLLDLGWTQAGTVVAFEQSSYGMDVATIGDSTEAGPYNSTFFVRAATAATGTYFDSPIASGYSIDNLAPGVPAAFAYHAGVLSWNESAAADFDFFSVYGSTTNSFGAATLVNYTTATSLDVSAASYAYYFVTATDFSGNEGNPAMINTLTGVGETPTTRVLSISAYPNPFNPATTIRYDVPARGHVVVSVYDAKGERVGTLVDETREPGSYPVRWDGTDARGVRASSGVYFVRLQFGGETRSRKIVLLK